MVTRRALITTGAVSTVLALTQIVEAPAASASPRDTTVAWRLDAAWAYPLGASGKLRCRSRACHRHAANKIVISQAAALGRRAHRGCIAPAYPIDIPTSVVNELTAMSSSPGELGDLRRPEVVAVLIAQTGVAGLPGRDNIANDGKATDNTPAERVRPDPIGDLLGLAATGASVNVLGKLGLGGILVGMLLSVLGDRIAANQAD